VALLGSLPAVAGQSKNSYKEVKIAMIGLSKLDVVTIFRRYLQDTVVEDSLISPIAMAVGEVIEENNKRLFEDLKANNSKKAGR